jgi:hypothetical protein
MGIKAYCINLERRQDRKESAMKEFAKHKIDVEFITAIDGSQILFDEIKVYNKEYACSVSHYKVWQDILKNNYDQALIFEDDIHLVDNFVKQLENILHEIKINALQWDIVNLGNIVATFLKTATQNLIYGKPTGMQSYIINKNCIKKIITLDIKDFDYGIDYQLCRLPLKILYTKERLSYQSKCKNNIISGIFTMINGDIGICNRTHDIEFLLVYSYRYIIGLVIICLLLIYSSNNRWNIIR